MSTIDQGRILNHYNLSQRRKKGFMPIRQQFANFDKRIGRSARSSKNLPRTDGYQLSQARKKEMFRRGVPLVFGFLISVVLLTYGTLYFLS